jgi:starch phosphorylase
MKASINGVLHLSIGDGWWAEGFADNNGWLIEGRAATAEQDAVDAADAEALYRLPEQEVVTFPIGMGRASRAGGSRSCVRRSSR